MTYMTKMKLSCGAHTLATFLFFASTVWADDPVDFEKVIAPILEQNCYDCHGADEKKGKLRLHTVADIQKAEVVVAGKPDESKLLQRISLAADSKKLMPKDGDPLPAEQIALIRLWIEQGSKYPAAEAGESTAADEPASEPSLFETITAAPEDAIVKVKETGRVGDACGQQHTGHQRQFPIQRRRHHRRRVTEPGSAQRTTRVARFGQQRRHRRGLGAIARSQASHAFAFGKHEHR